MEPNVISSRKIHSAALAVLTILSVFLIFKIIGEAKSWNTTQPGADVISVSGTGESFAVPDIATITFTADEAAPTVAEAQKKATDNNNAALKYLKDQGIDDRDIQTQSYNVMPQYDYNNVRYPSTPRIVGYQVTQTTVVKVRDTNKVASLLTGITAQGISNVSGPSLSIDDEDAIKAEARTEAIKDAKDKAEMLAKQLGVRLGKMTSFSESYGGYPVPMYAAMESKAMNMGMGGGGAPDIATGENKVTVTVQISYQIK